MQIERSLISGIIRTLNFPVTESQIEIWEQGADIRYSMPNLSDLQVNFILKEMVDINTDSFYKE